MHVGPPGIAPAIISKGFTKKRLGDCPAAQSFAVAAKYDAWDAENEYATAHLVLVPKVRNIKRVLCMYKQTSQAAGQLCALPFQELVLMLVLALKTCHQTHALGSFWQ